MIQKQRHPLKNTHHNKHVVINSYYDSTIYSPIKVRVYHWPTSLFFILFLITNGGLTDFHTNEINNEINNYLTGT